MASTEERNDEHLRIAYRQLQTAFAALDDAAHQLGLAGWRVTASDVQNIARDTESALDAIERYAVGLAVSL